MANEIVNMGDQFSGLPMADLIGAPLLAACDAQVILAKAAADFIDQVGLNSEDGSENKVARTVDFSMSRPAQNPDGSSTQEDISIQAPLLALVNVPSLSVKEVSIDFEMEVKSSFQEKSSKDVKAGVEASASAGWGWGKASVRVTGSVASHKESARSSDNSAKYTVHVAARDDGPPEGLSRLLDIMATAVAPVQKSLPAEPAPVTTSTTKKKN